jgi:hypothetical protein
MALPTFAMRSIRKLIHTVPVLAPQRTFKHWRGYKHFKQANAPLHRQFLDHLDLLELSPLEARHLDNLREQGCTILDGFFAAEVGAIKEAFDTEIASGTNILNGDISTFDHEYRQTLSDTLYHIPLAAELMYHPTLLKIAAHYKKQIPIYYGRAYRTIPMPEPLGSSSLHRDGYGDFTIFVFLEDVGPHNGAGMYVRRSHDYNFKSNIPYSFDERHVRDVYGRAEDWLTYCGSAGSVVIADTTGYHKGPVWPRFGDPANRSRDTLHWVCVGLDAPITGGDGNMKIRLRPETVQAMSPLQKAFLTNVEVVQDVPRSRET